MIENFDDVKINLEHKDEFVNYLELKGIERYRRLCDQIKPYCDELTYEIVSDHYRYDIKLRRMIFKAVGLLEIAFKAYICNRFEIKIITAKNAKQLIEDKLVINSKKKLNVPQWKIDCIFDEDKELSLYEFIERSDIAVLNSILLLLPKMCHKELFVDTEDLDKNLTAVKKLRNLAMHHNLLLGANFNKVYRDKKCYSGLNENIKNLISLVPKRARGNISNEFNNCIFIRWDEYNQKRKLNIVEEYILDVEVD